MSGKKFIVKRQAQSAYVYPPFKEHPVTYEEEVTANVIQWYMNLGLPVPQEELDACRGLDAAATATLQKELAEHKVVAPPPAYGTPEFWKQYWAKKKAVEAEAIARGEPIPEKKPKAKTKPALKTETTDSTTAALRKQKS